MEQPFTHSGTRDPAPSPREQENAALARQAAAAGIVLLKNRGVLPLNPDAPVALFGAGAGRTVKGGTGSGDVNNRASVSIWQGLKEAGVPLTSEDWLADCEARYTRAREDWRSNTVAFFILIPPLYPRVGRLAGAGAGRRQTGGQPV